MSQTRRARILVIGSGPAGYTAAIYAARANLSPVLVQGLQPGGQLTITTDVENYPGFASIVQGPWLMEQMESQAAAVGTETIYDIVTSVDFSARPFKCRGDSGTLYLADAVIIATGAKARWLGLESENRFNGLGVSACATCDGFFFRDREVAIIGGGNSAVEEALYLANICARVTLVHRRDALRAEKILQDRLFRNDKIDIVWNHVVDEIVGDEGGVNGVILRHTADGKTRRIGVSGVFVAIGHDPATEIFRGQLDMDEAGYILTAPDSTATNVGGVFAAGDVKDKVFRQAVTAAGLGCMAALEAEKYVAELEPAMAAEQA